MGIYVDWRNKMFSKQRTLKVIAFLIIGIFGYLLLGQDFKYFMSWWVTLLGLGIVFLPLSSKILVRFNDKGYLFSKVIGLAISSYLMWLLSSLKLLKFRSLPCLVIIAFFACLNFLVLLKVDLKVTTKNLKDKIDIYLSQELLFFAILLFGVFMRGFKPEAYGTEKFMDYGFMTSMMRADYMPPQDFWFAGEKLNYYYVGQYIATFLTKVSLVPVTHGYNLMLMTIAALSFVLTYSLVCNITTNYFRCKKIDVKYGPHIAGLLSAGGLSLAGNFHFTIFYYLIPNLQDMLGIERSSYWFSNSTRYIGYHPETADKTIHEFPSYSFILGDLHAHVLNIIFVLTIIAILYAWLLESKKINFAAFKNIKILSLIREIIQSRVLLIGFFIGFFRMTNFWDFPIYFVVAGGCVLFSLIRNYGFSKVTFLLTSVNGFIVVIVAELTSLLFTLSFDQISTNILVTTSRTPLYQLLILWGLPFVLVIGYIVELVQTHGIIIRVRNQKGLSPIKKKGISKIVNFLSFMSISDLFILVLALCGMGLVLMPELVYVEDIYSGDYKRANTMFKLTYQAFILFGICSGYIFVKFSKVKRYLWQRKFIAICFLLFASTLMYFPVAVEDWYGDLSMIDKYKGLDASAFLEEVMPEDYRAINWINENISGTAVILEANGDSYSDYQRVSVFTGHTTVLGWYVHEWLWRGDVELVNQRAADVEAIYTSDNPDEVISLIEKYDISYIYVGSLEGEKYPGLNHELVRSLGEVVYEDMESQFSIYNTYIVKIH